MRLILSIPTVAMYLNLIASTAIAQVVEHPIYTSWAASEPGTTITMRTVTTKGDGSGKVEATKTYELLEVTDSEVVVEVATTVARGGTNETNPPRKVTYKKDFPLFGGTKKEDVGKPKDVIDEGTETLEIDGEEFEATWYDYTGLTEAGESMIRTWICPEIPGRLLKSVTTYPDGSGKSVTEVIEYTTP